MKIKFENNLTYQNDALDSVVDVFAGQEKMQSNFSVLAPTGDSIAYSRDLGYSNKISLRESQLISNIQGIQMRNGLKISGPEEIDKNDLQFTVEMETGTGKTYVFTRSILEMNRRYGFTKFVIVVPSVSIREGIKKSLELTEDHFSKDFDNVPYKYFIYDSKNLSEVRDFATSNQIRIMIINIQAFAADMDENRKSKRILLEYNDKLGARPINLIRETRPVVIVDEPQSAMSSPLQKRSIKNLNSIAIFRYSATPKVRVNLLYKFDAFDAYNDRKVKQIEVASITARNAASDGAYIQLDSVSNKGGFSAVVHIDVRGKTGKVRRQKKKIRAGTDLYELTKLDQYQGFVVREINLLPEYVEFSNGQILRTGHVLGGMNDLELKRRLISRTIREHLDKELRLKPRGIKVLSLFFIDAVARYRLYDEEGNDSAGEYAQIFEEEYRNIVRLPKYQNLWTPPNPFPLEAADVHKGYFSSDRKGKKSNKKEKYAYIRDTSGSIKADEDTYRLIMQDKERLLSFEEPARFIFSHSALKEGWDNPNVFQICQLKEMGTSEIRRKQEIGRGLRISVDQSGNRVYDENVNILTAIVNESFTEFVEGYQQELAEETGIRFGYLEEESFNTVVTGVNEAEEPQYLGQEVSSQIFRHFIEMGYISRQGKVQDALKWALQQDEVDLGQEFEHTTERQILNRIKDVAGSLEIKNKDARTDVGINKEVYISEDFKVLWDSIKYKTVYQVDFDSEELIRKCVGAINHSFMNFQTAIEEETGLLDIDRGAGVTARDNPQSLKDYIQPEVRYLPDIITYLQNETDLTRRTIVSILRGLEPQRLRFFKTNPQAFIETCIDIINGQKRQFIIDGIKYHRLGEDQYYDQRLIEEDDLMGYVGDHLVEASKSVYQYTVCDSRIEANLAREFERSENISLYTKLPGWFTIPTPLGEYNPDWAIFYRKADGEKLYFITESKGSTSELKLRPTEYGKIRCGQEHFSSLSTRLIVASNMEEVHAQVNI